MPNKTEHRLCGMRLFKDSGKVQLSGFYRGLVGRREGLDIWMVDGSKVAKDLYPEFIMGGNDQRYRFNPLNEVWLDDRLGCDEMEYTLAHELLEVRLMREKRWTYDRAHNCSLDLEKTLRESNWEKSIRAARRLTRLVENREVPGLKNVDPALFPHLYRVFVGRAHGASIWIVDGGLIRRQVDPNFWAAQNGLMHNYVPKKEIWMDASTSALEFHLALKRQKLEYKLITDGSSQRRAYEQGLIADIDERERQACLCKNHEAGLAPVSYGARARGVKR